MRTVSIFVLTVLALGIVGCAAKARNDALDEVKRTEEKQKAMSKSGNNHAAVPQFDLDK